MTRQTRYNRAANSFVLEEPMKRSILVVGGGASGMMAAIHAARAGASVTIMEHMDRVGKKILSTGNGKCNLTNLEQLPGHYRSSTDGFAFPVIEHYPAEKTLEFFQELGIWPKSRGGYIYPNSDQASAVLDVLRMELEYRGIEVICGCHVTGIEKKGKQFQVQTPSGRYQADAVILAAGSKAAPVTGSDGSGYDLAKAMGHRIVPPLPALVQLCCQEKHYKQLSGIRTEARLTLFVNQKEVIRETGELQLTDYGISGIPTFQVSRFASQGLYKKQLVTVRIDFFPDMDDKTFKRMFFHRIEALGYKTWEEWMTGLLNKKLALVLLKLSGIRPDQVVSRTENPKCRTLMSLTKNYETVIIDTKPYENAQVCCGGVDCREIDPKTMESRLVKGLYFAGELLDVDGICGGYNLQWAWSSGAIAGMAAARGKQERTGKGNI